MLNYRVEQYDAHDKAWYVVDSYSTLEHAVEEYRELKTSSISPVRIVRVVVQYIPDMNKEIFATTKEA